MSADGGRSGQFASVTSNLAFLDPTLSYDPTKVYLTMNRNDVGFDDIGGSRNQIAAGNGAESLGYGNPIFNAVLNLSAQQALNAFDALSGEIHATAKSALIDDSRFVRDAANDRLRAAFDGIGASRGSVMAYEPNGAVLAPATAEGLVAWGQVLGSWGHNDADGNAARLKHDTSGLLMGADAAVFGQWRVGVIAGYSHSSFDVKDRVSSAKNDSYHLGLYGGTQWDKIGLRTGLAYSWHDIDTVRTVDFTGYDDRLSTGYKADTFQAFGDLGYRIDSAMASFEPFANLAHVTLNTDGFSEQGGKAALSSTSQSTSTTFTTLGLRASTRFTLGEVKATARGTLGWKHAFDDTVPLATQAFATGDAFTIAGTPIAKDAAVVETGLDFNLSPSAKLGIAYNGQLAKDAQQHGFKVNIRVQF